MFRFHVATPDWQSVTGGQGLLVGGQTVDPNQWCPDCRWPEACPRAATALLLLVAIFSRNVARPPRAIDV